jgi:ribosomal protein S12 methylthiotransferase accessory factor
VIATPRFTPQFRVEMMPGEGVLLLSDAGHAVLNGRLFERVASMIDGRRTTDEIVDALHGDVSAAEVYYAIGVLAQKGYVQEGGRSIPAGTAVFWAVRGIDPEQASERLARTTVRVVTLGDIDPAPLVETLESADVRVEPDGQLHVVATDDYLRGDLQAHNAEAIASGRRWMLVKPVGRQMLVGPAFGNPEEPCWACLAQRLRLNRAVELFAARRRGCSVPLPVPFADTPATRQIAYGVAAAEIAAWIARGGPTDPGTLLAIDAVTFASSRHRVAKQLDCPACARRKQSQAWPRVHLQPCPKGFTEDGGHRAVSPEETLERYERHVSPITGALSGLHRHPAGNGTLHVYFAGDNFAVPHARLKDLQESFRSRSAGKGISDVQARASCLGEALERYSACFRGTEPRHRSTFTRMQGLAIHPNECMRFSDRQYQDRTEINARAARFGRVPVRFDPDAEIEWTPVWSLTNEVHRFLPTAFCYFGYPDTLMSCVPCSNGNAAGNTLEEAVLQGFLELVERDSIGLWWYNRARVPAIDLESFDEPYLRTLTQFLRERGRELWVLDVTSDLGIPACAAVSRLIDQPREHIALGFGAHLDPRIALLRAVTELNQSLAWMLPAETGAQEDLAGLEDKEVLHWLTTATVAAHPYLRPNPAMPAKRANAYAVAWTDDLRDDIQIGRQAVEGRGMEMLVLDQTRPDIGLPVVKVIVPGLRHFWPRFGPGRLYDVPPALGWRDAPVPEEDLNPVAMFL